MAEGERESGRQRGTKRMRIENKKTKGKAEREEERD